MKKLTQRRKDAKAQRSHLSIQKYDFSILRFVLRKPSMTLPFTIRLSSFRILSVLLASLRLCAFALISSSLSAQTQDPSKKKVILLGIDGLDPKLLQKFVDAGRMPNFKRLIAQGSFKPLQSSAPPLSPTAWSTFITGMDPGGHGIYDFVHRDPATLLAHLSMAATEPGRSWGFGTWSVPLGSGNIKSLRQGRAFWELLEERGVHTTIYKMPANFPPVKTRGGEALSGMGTPDIRGTPGTFRFFTTKVPSNVKDITGGEVVKVEVVDNHVDGTLIGPASPFRREAIEESRYRLDDGTLSEPDYRAADTKIDFSVFLDPEEPVAKIAIQDTELILKQGEWSDWITVNFDFIPHAMGASAIGRFYLQEVRPDFKLYVSPLHIDPVSPAMPISNPSKWSSKLADTLGPYYTKELPEETKALSGGIFTGEEFMTQARMVYDEQRRALDLLLSNYKDGLLFFYFSTIDQCCHMLWRYADPAHPGYVKDEKLADAIGEIYGYMDDALEKVMTKVDGETTLIVMSDHGFSPFYWGVNLNSWLLDKGYVKMKPSFRRTRSKYFEDVDWSRTKAYALGLNGLYINLKGREKDGIISGLESDGSIRAGSEYEKVLDQLERDLLELRDPRDAANPRQPITLVTRTRRDFHGDHLDIGPDAIVGYNYGYRTSWESPLGEFPKEIFVDNKDAWSGDHCMDYRVVPGVLITNQKISLETPALHDLTVSVLSEYGVEPLNEMIGKDCLAPAAKPWENLSGQ